MKDLLQLTKLLEYPKEDLELLNLALTHKSYGFPNNERLEFLGDSIISFIVSTELYTKFINAKEGDLTRARAKLVCGDNLAEIAKEKQLGKYLKLGFGEKRAGSFQKSSILADCLEAIIGAVYLKCGLEHTKKILLDWLQPSIEKIGDPSLLSKDPKTQLQEYYQARGLDLPEYEVIEVVGEQHSQKFFVTCKLNGLEKLIHGQGSSRRKAEQQAAQNALMELDINERK